MTPSVNTNTPYDDEERGMDDADMPFGEPPPMTAEEYRIENIGAIIEEAVLNAKGLVSEITDLMDLNVGNRAALLTLRGALNDFLDEYDPDMDDGRNLEDLS